MTQQKADDRNFLANIIVNELQVTETDERKAQVVLILQRVVIDIRGGPTKAILHDLQEFVQGDGVFDMETTKKNMEKFLLRKIQTGNGEQGAGQQVAVGENNTNQQVQNLDQNDAVPSGAPPPDWEDMVPQPVPQQQQQRQQNYKALMRAEHNKCKPIQVRAATA